MKLSLYLLQRKLTVSINVKSKIFLIETGLSCDNNRYINSTKNIQ